MELLLPAMGRTRDKARFEKDRGSSFEHVALGFPGGSVVKNLPANAGDTGEAGSSPGLGKSPGGGRGTPLQYSCLVNPIDRGVWWATVHGVTNSRTRLND